MKKSGAKYSVEAIKKAIKDYENSELGWDEIEEKHNIPKGVLQYHRRKEKQNNGIK